MEYIDINGERVLIPADVVSDSRDAVAAFCATQAAPSPTVQPSVADEE